MPEGIPVKRACMTSTPDFEIFLMAPPGLEAVLCEEARARRFAKPKIVAGGVEDPRHMGRGVAGQS